LGVGRGGVREEQRERDAEHVSSKAAYHGEF
jgi:hypothetical protein